MDLKKLDAAQQRLRVLERRMDALRDRSNATTSALIHWGRKGVGTDPACGRNAAVTYAREKYESFPEDARCQLCQRAYEKLRDKTGGTFSFKKADADGDKVESILAEAKAEMKVPGQKWNGTKSHGFQIRYRNRLIREAGLSEQEAYDTFWKAIKQ